MRLWNSASRTTREWLAYAAGLLLLACLLGYASYHDHQIIQESESRRLHSHANVIHDLLHHELMSTSQTLAYLRKDLRLEKLTSHPETANDRLRAFTQALPPIRTLLITDASGRVLASNHDALIGRDVSHRDYFQATQQAPHPETLYVSPPFQTSLGSWTMNLSRVIRDRHGKFAGVISASLDPDIFRVLLMAVRDEPDVWAGLAHGSGILYMTAPDQPDIIGKNLSVPGSMFTRHMVSGQEASLLSGRLYATGQERLMVIRTLRPAAVKADQPLIIVVSRDPKMAYAQWRTDLWRHGLVLAVLSILTALMLALSQTRRRETESALVVSSRQLQEAQAHLERFFSIAPDMLCIVDMDGRFLELNPAWENTLGHPLAELKHARFMNYVHPDDHQATLDAIARLAKGESVLGFINRYRHRDGSYRHIEWRTAPLGQLLYAAARDVTERVQSEEIIRRQAFYDKLTNLPNRALLIERLRHEMAHARRDQSLLALLFVDLNKFKPVNDRYGHRVGDWLLQAVARRIEQCIRESDTAARIGGDEFVILLPRIALPSKAAGIAETLCHVLAQPFLTPETLVLEISASIGIALYPDHANNALDLLEAGDEAMYRAKQLGGNRVVIHENLEATPEGGASPQRAHLLWKSAFESGNPVIDAEHRELFRISNRLFERMARPDMTREAVGAAFENLLERADRHFDNEEEILRQLNYAHADDHAAEHGRLLQRAAKLHGQIMKGESSFDELREFIVTDFIRGHLQHDDVQFFKLFTPDPEAGDTSSAQPA